MLCEVEDVRAFLQKQEAATSQDEIIETLIGVASELIPVHCEREFEKPDPDAEETRRFEYEGGGILLLAPYDLRSLTKVEIDTDEAEPTTLESEEVRMPAPLKDGVATYLRLAPYLSHSRSRWQQRLVDVTGKWGFDAVPATVKQAAVLAVSIWLRRDVSAFTKVFDVETQHVELPEELPTAVKGSLKRYVRQSYV